MRTSTEYRIQVGSKTYIHDQRTIEKRLRCIQGVRLRRPETINPIVLITFAIMQGFSRIQFRVAFRNYDQASAWMAQVRLQNHLCRDHRFVSQFNTASAHLASLHSGYTSFEMQACESDALFIDEVEDDFVNQYGTDVARMPVQVVVDGTQYNLITDAHRTRYVPSCLNVSVAAPTAPAFTKKPRAVVQSPPSRFSFARSILNRPSSIQTPRQPQPSVCMPTNASPSRSSQTTTNSSSVHHQPARGFDSYVNSRISQPLNVVHSTQSSQPVRGFVDSSTHTRSSQQMNTTSVNNQPARGFVDSSTHTRSSQQMRTTSVNNQPPRGFVDSSTHTRSSQQMRTTSVNNQTARTLGNMHSRRP